MRLQSILAPKVAHEIKIHDYCGYPKIPAHVAKMNDISHENKSLSHIIEPNFEGISEISSRSPSLKQKPIDEENNHRDEQKSKKFKPSEIEVLSLNPIKMDMLKTPPTQTPKEIRPKFSQLISRSENQDPQLPPFLPSTSGPITSKLEAYLACNPNKKGYVNYQDDGGLRSPSLSSQGSGSEHALSSGLYSEQASEDNGSRRWKRFSADEERQILEYAEKVVAESLVSGTKPNLDGVNVWKRATKEGVCPGRSPIALYGWFMRYKSGKIVKTRHGTTSSLQRESEPSTPTTPGVTAIISEKPLSLADLTGGMVTESLTFSEERLKEDQESSPESQQSYQPMKQSEMFEIIQQKIHFLEDAGESEMAATIERISYLVLATMYKSYVSDQPVEKLIHDEAECLLKCSRCQEMLDYFSAQNTISELIEELRERRQKSTEQVNVDHGIKQQLDGKEQVNGSHSDDEDSDKPIKMESD